MDAQLLYLICLTGRQRPLWHSLPVCVHVMIHVLTLLSLPHTVVRHCIAKTGRTARDPDVDRRSNATTAYKSEG